MKKKKEKSIKTSFWEKIKNIFNNSPWHAAFTYPIAYIIMMPILAGALWTINNEGGPLVEVGVSLIFSIFLTPIWVFAGLFISKKKTPYILSLVIGFGLFFFLIYSGMQFFNSLK